MFLNVYIFIVGGMETFFLFFYVYEIVRPFIALKSGLIILLNYLEDTLFSISGFQIMLPGVLDASRQFLLVFMSCEYTSIREIKMMTMVLISVLLVQ